MFKKKKKEEKVYMIESNDIVKFRTSLEEFINKHEIVDVQFAKQGTYVAMIRYINDQRTSKPTESRKN
jgi:hypothetical protein